MSSAEYGDFGVDARGYLPRQESSRKEEDARTETRGRAPWSLSLLRGISETEKNETEKNEMEKNEMEKNEMETARMMKRTRAPKSSQLELFNERRSKRAKQPQQPQRVVTTRRSSRVPHEVRPEVRGPLHVVLRIRRGLPCLRTPRALRRLEGAFRKGREKPGFALLHYSVQHDHLHLVVETESKGRLALGMQGLEIRVAKALNAEALIRRLVSGASDWQLRDSRALWIRAG